MANTFVSLNDIAFSALDFLFRKATLLTSVWRDVVAVEIAKNRGETVTVRTPPSYVANDYDGVTLTVQDTTEGSVDVVLDKDKEVTARFSTREQGAAFADIETMIIGPAMDALVRKVESDIELSLRTDAIAAPRVFGNAIFGVDVEVADIADARKALNEEDVIMDERFLWLSPKDGANLIQKSTFTDNSASQRDTLSTGGLGTVFGFFVGESNAIVTNTGPDPDETYNLFFHRHASTIAMRALPLPNTAGVEASSATSEGLTINVTKQWDVDRQSTVLVFRALYGVKTLDINRAGILRG